MVMIGLDGIVGLVWFGVIDVVGVVRMRLIIIMNCLWDFSFRFFFEVNF